METPFVIRTSQFVILPAAVLDFTFEAVDGEVQTAEAAGFVGFLDAVEGEPGQMSKDECRMSN